jgi:hypothetical protein
MSRYPKDAAELARRVRRESHPASWFRVGRRVTARDKMTSGYTYTLAAPPGRLRAGLAAETRDAGPFRPKFSPAQMLALGVFEGKYLNDCWREFPREWYLGAIARGKLSPGGANPELNCFKTKSRLSLGEWRRRRWIPAAAGDRDVRGWFQWYARFWLGRRQPAVDRVQVARWRAFVRHSAQVTKSAKRERIGRSRAARRRHRPRQRQALLQWAWNCWI